MANIRIGKKTRAAGGKKPSTQCQSTFQATHPESKKSVNAVEAKDRAAAETAYKAAVPVIDAMVNKGIIHKNKAARHKSRLNSHIRALPQDRVE